MVYTIPGRPKSVRFDFSEILEIFKHFYLFSMAELEEKSTGENDSNSGRGAKFSAAPQAKKRRKEEFVIVFV